MNHDPLSGHLRADNGEGDLSPEWVDWLATVALVALVAGFCAVTWKAIQWPSRG